MAVKVYFENSFTDTAISVAVFDNEEVYIKCYPILEQIAKKDGWDMVTETLVDNVSLNDVFHWMDA
jgi:hypothetical protein